MSAYLYLFTFFIGLVWAPFVSALPDIRESLFLIVCALVLVVLRTKFRSLSPFAIAAALAIFGFVLNSWHLHIIVGEQMDARYEGRDILAEVKVLGDVSAVGSKKIRFDAELIGFSSKSLAKDKPEELLGKRLRLSSFSDSFLSAPKEGDVWELVLRLKRPRGFVNPGGFDYQAWLLYHHYRATGYVKQSPPPRFVEEQSISPINQLRTHLAVRLFTNHKSEFSGFFRALLLGDRSQVKQDQWDVLIATGTAHLMAISGLHIGLVAFFAFSLSRVFLAVFRVDHGLILRIVPCFSSIACAGIYAALSGFAIPAQRAWLMVAVINTLLFCGRKIGPLYLLLFVAVIVVLLNPLTVTQNSFYLSFLAVFILMLAFGNRTKKLGAIKGLIWAQWVICLGLCAVLVLRQLPISLVSPIANLLAVPVISFLVIPLLFLSAAMSMIHQGLAEYVMLANEEVFAMLWYVLQEISSWREPLFIAPPRGWISVVLAAALLLCLLLPRALCLRWWGMSLLLLLCFPRSAMESAMEITVLDVGQGLSVVTKMKEHTVVYDVGAKFSERFDIGSRVLSPFLRYQNIRAVDLLVVSHGDNDHAGGLPGLVKNTTVRALAANHSNAVADSYTKKYACEAGQEWTFDDVNYRVLWPLRASLATQTENNRSCVLLIQQGSFSALYAGDIERSVEKTLLTRGVLPERVDLLIAPHHGSNTSSSESFVAHVQPKIVVFSAGYKNAYGHPTQRVRNRYQKYGSKTLNTAESGGITIRVDPLGNMQFSSARIARRRPWYL